MMGRATRCQNEILMPWAAKKATAPATRYIPWRSKYRQGVPKLRRLATDEADRTITRPTRHSVATTATINR